MIIWMQTSRRQGNNGRSGRSEGGTGKMAGTCGRYGCCRFLLPPDLSGTETEHLASEERDIFVSLVISCPAGIVCGMTLQVALKGSDGLVLAADSRGIFGDPRGVTAQNDAMEKAFTVSPHVAVLMAGAGELGNTAMLGAVAKIKEDGLDGVQQVLEPLRQHFRQQYATWFPQRSCDTSSSASPSRAGSDYATYLLNRLHQDFDFEDKILRVRRQIKTSAAGTYSRCPRTIVSGSSRWPTGLSMPSGGTSADTSPARAPCRGRN